MSIALDVKPSTKIPSGSLSMAYVNVPSSESPLASSSLLSLLSLSLLLLLLPLLLSLFSSPVFSLLSLLLLLLLLPQAPKTKTNENTIATTNHNLLDNYIPPYYLSRFTLIFIFVQKTCDLSIRPHLLQLRNNFFTFWHRYWASCMKNTTSWWVLWTWYIPLQYDAFFSFKWIWIRNS